MNFCSRCANPLVLRGIDTDARERLCCDHCGAIHYANPSVLVACIAYCGDRLLMCRRAHEPGFGLWEVPSGFVEAGESLEHAATREVAEETGVRISPERLELYSVLSLPDISQVYIAFRTELPNMPVPCAGPECLDVAMIQDGEIPPNQWAFGGGICGRPNVLFREICTRTFAIHKRRIGGPTSDGTAVRAYSLRA